MNSIISIRALFVCAFTILSLCIALPYHANAADSDWQLVWFDEFNGNGHLSEKWGQEYGIIRQREAQFYLENDLDNCRQQNNKLIIEARNEYVYANGVTTPPTRDILTKSRAQQPIAKYTSCSVYSNQRWLYGRFEIRAKLPRGQGVFPALWLRNNTDFVNSNWMPPTPAYNEIDIMEYIGNRDRYKIYSTLHWGPDYQNIQYFSRNIVDPQIEDGFHLYVLEWTKDYIRIWVDDKLVSDFALGPINNGNNLQHFRVPMFLRMNFALGAENSWAGPVGEGTLPQTFEIDYVRVYQKVPNNIADSGDKQSYQNNKTYDGSRDRNAVTDQNMVASDEAVTVNNATAQNVTVPNAAVPLKAPVTRHKSKACLVYGKGYEAKEIEYNGKKLLRCFPKAS